MTDKNNIDENELDELLRQHALNNGADDSLAEAILSQEYNVQVDKTKEEAVLIKLNRNISGGSNFRPFIYGGVVVLMIAAFAFYFAASKRTTQNEAYATNDSTQNTTIDAIKNSVEGTVFKNADGQQTTPTIDTFGKINRLYAPVYIDSTKATPVSDPAQNQPVLKKTEQPYLAEKDRLRYAKVKQQMLEKLYQKDKALYTYIPANKMEYAGRPTVIDGFSIRNVAITNLEYKTFLADLLTQNRSEEYYKAEVLSLQWKQEGYNKLAYEYFQNDRYNDFPVVNISVEGAKIFCKWLDEELKLYIERNKLKSKALSIRMPYDKEWMLAARDGYAKIAFETGYNTMYEIGEGLVDLSFIKRLHQIRKKAMSKDTLYPLYITNRYGWEEQKAIAFLEKPFAAYSCLPADTIYSDRMKVFGKIGHVSEIVTQQNTDRVWLGGFTWPSKETYLALEEKFKAAKVSPFVGFRIVVIDKADPEYKDPFW